MTTHNSGWKWGVLTALVFVLLGLWPHVSLWTSRGSQWQGANAQLHPDEVAYSAYVASLIEARPRRNDPYTGRQDGPDAALGESLFSIQFIPAYSIALPARLVGIDASTAFIIASLLAAALSTLAIYWLISTLTGDSWLSGAGVCVVLGLGTLCAGQGAARHLLNLNYLIPEEVAYFFNPPSVYHLPFLRLYQPAIPFPLFFVMAIFLWHALTTEDQGRRVFSALLAGIVFAILVFSYFFLWTAAGAWAGTIALLWFAARPSERGRVITVFGVFGACGMAALLPFFLILSHRSETVDAAQALIYSHQPDLLRVPEIVGALATIALPFTLRLKREEMRSPVLLFAVSMLLFPFVIFNQQVVTGRLLQSVHYEWFIANYVVLTGLVLSAWFLWRSGATSNAKLLDKHLVAIACAAIAWAGIEVWLTTSIAAERNNLIDESKAVAARLVTLSKQDSKNTGSAHGQGDPGVALVIDLMVADRLPTDAPQSVLWSPHMLVFPAVTVVENRERFYKQLYYAGYDRGKLLAELGRHDWNFWAGLFDYSRLSPAITGKGTPITPSEIDEEVSKYLSYSESFNLESAKLPQLSYVIAPAQNEPNYQNLDHWYYRDNGERIGKFVLYRLRPRF